MPEIRQLSKRGGGVEQAVTYKGIYGCLIVILSCARRTVWVRFSSRFRQLNAGVNMQVFTCKLLIHLQWQVNLILAGSPLTAMADQALVCSQILTFSSKLGTEILPVVSEMQTPPALGEDSCILVVMDCHYASGICQSLLPQLHMKPNMGCSVSSARVNSTILL